MDPNTRPFTGMRIKMADFCGIVVGVTPKLPFESDEEPRAVVHVAWIKNAFRGQSTIEQLDWDDIVDGIEDNGPTQLEMRTEYLRRLEAIRNALLPNFPFLFELYGAFNVGGPQRRTD